ncbi:TetR family transcriptional regulator [Streptomyces sp. TRM43335]|uniref:TetR family transcriptional regulator n=1 Tax=Streptomyces taklimakanensis TaxID=2569853 RepID=A0A6G2BDF3_9ACTN|nr:TetR/AcrR family transcriptional regulator [Streptomyces taklimakanensis]MTE20109.1 TetR family transcriptional regulator [Streptomyces taklimakanensis]
MASGSRTGRPPRTSVWLDDRLAPKRRSNAEQPSGLDRERITAAAVRLLDAEGLEKFSMRRLAAELGVTAMSVYWYVDTKDDLLELALDSVFGEIDLPVDSPDADWRDQVRRLADEYRGLMVGHPWVSSVLGRYLNIGPRAMEFADAARRVVERAGLPAPRITGALSALFQFVYGFGTIEANWNSRCREAGLGSDEFFHRVFGKVRGRAEYATSLELMEQRGGDTVDEMRQRDFDIALECLIAGIETMRERGTGEADAAPDDPSDGAS